MGGWMDDQMDSWLDGCVGVYMGEKEGLGYRFVETSHPCTVYYTIEKNKMFPAPLSVSNPYVTGLPKNIRNPHASLLWEDGLNAHQEIEM